MGARRTDDDTPQPGPREPATGEPVNPFAPETPYEQGPEPPPLGTTRPSADPSVDQEPHLRGGPIPVTTNPLADRAELDADRQWAADADLSEADHIEHTVWDEPALSVGLTGPPPDDQPTYARWLEKQIAATSDADSWRTTLLVALAAGPWGIAGALASQLSAGGGIGFSGVMAAVVLAPVTEEITKIAAALWVVEKRPFRFKSPVQVMLCAAVGGLAFATIENLLYLGVYNPVGGAGYAAWRWVVCTALHVTCSTIAGVGLLAIWRASIAQRRRPELALGMPLFAAAMVLHGLYNATVTLAEASGVLSF